MVRRPSQKQSLPLWLAAQLDPIHLQLDVDVVARALGSEAAHAFDFGGIGLLATSLDRLATSGASARDFVVDGVIELAGNANLDPAAQRWNMQDRQQALLSAREGEPSRSTHDHAAAACHHFFRLAQATLARTNFGGPERGADIACFETFRLAAIAADRIAASGLVGEADKEPKKSAWRHLSSSLSARPQAQVLVHLLGYHPSFEADADATDLVDEMLDGITLVGTETTGMQHHSLVLRIASSNAGVSERLADCALRVMNTVSHLDERSRGEPGEATIQSDAGGDLANDLALVESSMFVVPRGRTRLVKRDPEFDALWRIYQRSVPWTTRNRRPRDR